MNGGVIVCGLILIGLACVMLAPPTILGHVGAPIPDDSNAETPVESDSPLNFSIISVIFALLGILLILSGFFL
jgi:hypothetical protein